MASYRRRGKSWTVYWYATDPATGQRRQKSKGGFATRRDAVAWHTRRESERLQGFTGAPEDMTVAQLLRAYLDSRPAGRVSIGSMATYEDQVRLYIAPHLGAIPVAKLTSMLVQRWHNTLLAQPLAPRTVRHAHTLLSSALTNAVLNGLIHRNVCQLAPPPAVPRQRRARLDIDAARAFLATSEGHRFGLLYRTMLVTLVRPGEALALRWSDIDWRRGTIYIHRTRKRGPENRLMLGEGAKSRAGNRTVAIHDELLQRLRNHRHDQITHRLQYAELWHEHDLVFCRDNGTMLANTTIDRALTLLCEDAGLPRLTPHGLRHTGASIMVELNIHLKAISERLGHSSIAMTADVYLEVSEGLQRQVAGQMAEALDTGS